VRSTAGPTLLEGVLVDWVRIQPAAEPRLPVAWLSKQQKAAELERLQRARAMTTAREAELILGLAEDCPADMDLPPEAPGAGRSWHRTEPEFPGVSEFFPDEVAHAINLGRGTAAFRARRAYTWRDDLPQTFAALRRGELSPALGITGGDLTLRVERLISPHHAASAPRLASVMLASALCLSGFLALASAQHLPLPLSQGMLLSVPQLVQSAAQAAEGLTSRQQLIPTQVEALLPEQGLVQRLSTGGIATASLQAVPAPQAPAPVSAEETVTPVTIGGAPLASLLPATDSVRSVAFDISRHSAAPMKVINMNHVDAQAPKGEHEYCEPITGSRVCN